MFALTIVGCGEDGGSSPDAAAGGDAPPDAPVVLPCADPDVIAPVLVASTPDPDTIGVDPATPVHLAIGDGCGVIADTVFLTMDGRPVIPVLGGDTQLTTLDFTPPDGFVKDAVVTLRVGARDAAGNALDREVRFRIWDDLRLWAVVSNLDGNFIPEMTGIDAARPTSPLPVMESYSASATQRVLVRFSLGATGDPASRPWDPGSRVVDAAVVFCNHNALPAAASVTAYALNAGFAAREATWTQRRAGTAWSAAGADGVPGDRAGTATATLSWPVADPYSQASSDVTAQTQSWLDAAATNHGFVIAGGAQRVDLLAVSSNCPPNIVGHRGRPLP